MAAKNKRPSWTAGRGPPGSDVADEFGTHLRASRHRDDLLEEARSLQASGKIRAARAVERRAQQVEQLMGALESEYRQQDPHTTK
jgi:hypothetical protein